jgi:hypothetical protein
LVQDAEKLPSYGRRDGFEERRAGQFACKQTIDHRGPGDVELSRPGYGDPRLGRAARRARR